MKNTKKKVQKRTRTDKREIGWKRQGTLFYVLGYDMLLHMIWIQIALLKFRVKHCSDMGRYLQFNVNFQFSLWIKGKSDNRHEFWYKDNVRFQIS